jgi:hypothetical protein
MIRMIPRIHQPYRELLRIRWRGEIRIIIGKKIPSIGIVIWVVQYEGIEVRNEYQFTRNPLVGSWSSSSAVIQPPTVNEIVYRHL